MTRDQWKENLSKTLQELQTSLSFKIRDVIVNAYRQGWNDAIDHMKAVGDGEKLDEITIK